MDFVKIIAVDFDGCLCENAWPDIGDDNPQVVRALLEEQKQGAKLILWTCRGREAGSSAALVREPWHPL